MDITRVKQQLRLDEGVRLRVYKDSVGLPTVGVGHLVLPVDRLSLGDVITQARCEVLFSSDLARTIHACETKLEGWADFPGEIQEVLANMAFNLGIAGLLKFVTTLRHLRNKDYVQAAEALIRSKWYTQVGNRSKRLVARVRALAS